MENELFTLPSVIADSEYLYRGIVKQFWDNDNKRISSAAFKDSNGVSVNRDANLLSEEDAIQMLLELKDFGAVCKVKSSNVRIIGALPIYCPVEHNIFHSEIHNSEDIIPLSRSQARHIRDESEVIYIDLY